LSQQTAVVAMEHLQEPRFFVGEKWGDEAIRDVKIWECRIHQAGGQFCISYAMPKEINWRVV
jgi:hypothetical protein